jgi:hypothetical protein
MSGRRAACRLAVGLYALSPATARAEHWDYPNDPGILDPSFVYEVSQLPATGAPANVPQPGWYWTTYQDSINYRWNGGDLAPSEKFAYIFGRPQLMQTISLTSGVLSQSGLACANSEECPGANVYCGQVNGAVGVCIPSWFGLCNGWAGFAASEVAPVSAVVRNGATFYPNDIEALMTLLYGDELDYREIGDRCDQTTPTVNSVGRDTDLTCRNINAGAFHVLMANLIGLRSGRLVVNENASGEVWNRPVMSYSVTNTNPDGTIPQVDAVTALELLGLDVKYVSLQSGIAVAPYGQVGSSFVVPASGGGQYIFYASGSGLTSLSIMDSASNAVLCNSFTGGSIQECLVNLTASQQVDYLLTSTSYKGAPSVNVSLVTPKADAPYVYNESASQFYFVQMSSQLTGTPSAPTSSDTGVPVGNPHLHQYAYVLETDAAGNILGGEWVAGSKSDHPNFAWSPVQQPHDFGGGLLKYNEVKSLLNESAGLTTNYTAGLVNPLIVSRRAGTMPVIVSPAGWVGAAPLFSN